MSTRPTYDPRAWGARCDECLLNEKRVVPPEWHRGATVAIVGQEPGEEEEIEGRPYVGPSWFELKRALDPAGVTRKDVHITNAALCRPDRNNMDAVIQRARDAGLPSPYECCRPRLQAEIADFDRIIPMGNAAAKGVIPGFRVGILSARGSMIEAPPPTEKRPPTRIVPTVNPAFVLHAPRFRHMFQGDIARAFRWFRDALRWREPSMLIRPSAAQLIAWLRVPTPFHAWDLETDAKEALIAKIRCIQLADATGDRVVVVPLLSIDGHTRFYTEVDERAVVRVLIAHLLDPSKLKVGWNSGIYDDTVIMARWGITAIHHLDGILAHRNASPELPHSLAFVGSIYTDVHAWKADAGSGKKVATDPRSDEELWHYGGLDAAVTSRVFLPILRDVKARGCVSTMELDHSVQKVCRELHAVGMPLDEFREKPRYRWEAWKRNVGTEDAPRWHDTARKMPLNAAAWDQKLTEDATFWLGKAREALAEDTRLAAAVRKAVEEELNLGGGGPTMQLDAADYYADDPLGTIEGRYDPERGAASEDMVGDLDIGDVLTLTKGGDWISKFNPGSPHQLRKIFYDQWGLVPPSTLPRRVAYTSADLYSTGDAVLIAFLCDKGLDASRRRVMRAVRGFRRAIKLRGTYVRPVLTSFGEGAGARWFDDRVRSSWNCHVTSPGRLSCSQINLQNVKGKLRTMYRVASSRRMRALLLQLLRDVERRELEAQWGTDERGCPRAWSRTMAGADADQIHLRIIAARWKVERLLECFSRNGDPHAEAALAAFGDAFRNAPGWPAGSDPRRGFVAPGGKWSGLAKQMRQIAKILQYAAAYGANAATIWQILLATEDDDGELVNLKMELPYVHLLHENWLKGMPEFPRGWDAEISAYRQQGFIREPVTGRRCDFLDGEDFNAIVNWPVLASEAAIMHKSMLRFVEAVPFGKWGPGTGLINQCHDSLTAETLLHLGREVAEQIAGCIAQPVPCYSDVRFTASGTWGPTWLDA